MKIAVTYENGEVFQHFGHTEQFKIYEIEDGKILSSEIINSNGSGHGALADFLEEADVDMLICGGIGGGARMALAQVGIRVYGGISGSVDEAIEKLISGKLIYNPNPTCNHHHEDGHSCGEHHCGEHHCHH